MFNERKDKNESIKKRREWSTSDRNQKNKEEFWLIQLKVIGRSSDDKAGKRSSNLEMCISKFMKSYIEQS